MAEGSASGPGRTFGSAPGRRLSYASVASGVTQPNIASPSRSGTFAHLATTVPRGTVPQSTTLPSPAHRRQSQASPDSRSYIMSVKETRRTPSLPEHSRKYANVGRLGPNAFFIPSYLENSRYASKLEAAHAAKSRTTGERSSSTPSLATSSGNANVQRMAPSHRGMTYDIIESNPPKDEDEIMPLPSRWNNQDKYPGMEVTNDGLDVKYNGAAGKAEQEAASVRADYPMSPACGIYYYEVEVKQKSKDCAVAIGFATLKASLERLPGWEGDSWGYHGDDGRTFWGEHQGRNYGPTFAAGDVVGCGLNFNTGQAFFTRNGLDLGVAFRDLKNLRPFPSVGIKKYSGAVVSVNFGQRPFVYDINSTVEREKVRIREKIKSTPNIPSLHPGLDEHTLIQELVAQFLSHGGYVGTAQAFAQERRTEQNALNENQSSIVTDGSESDTTGAVYRQEIRRAILDGNIDQSLSLTNEYFPTVLAQSPEIAFRLKCRKWIELIGTASDLSVRQNSGARTSQKSGRTTSSSSFDAVEDVFDQHMELDEDQTQQSTTNGKAVAQPDVSSADGDVAYSNLLNEAMEYGQLLNREYRDETDSEYNRTLADVFSLLAYTEPRESVHGHLLEAEGRAKVAEELNSAILVSLGRSPSAALEKTYRQTEALLDILSQDGGPAAFVNLKSDFAL